MVVKDVPDDPKWMSGLTHVTEDLFLVVSSHIWIVGENFVHRSESRDSSIRVLHIGLSNLKPTAQMAKLNKSQKNADA